MYVLPFMGDRCKVSEQDGGEGLGAGWRRADLYRKFCFRVVLVLSLHAIRLSGGRGTVLSLFLHHPPPLYWASCRGAWW